MLKQKLEKAFNNQMNAEMYSSYLYLAMSAYFESISLSGFAKWMRMQSREENFHAEKFFDYINERGGRVTLQKIDTPPNDWKSPLDVMKEVLAHEQKVTALINDLVDLAIKEKDHASNIFLQWFVSEQVEEEDNVGSVLDKLKLINQDSGGMFILDQEMALRVFTPPAN